MTTNNNDPLSPDHSPGALNEKVGVRRVNKIPLMILAGGLLVFLIIIAMVAYDRSAKSQKPPAPRAEKKTTVTTATFAKAAIGDNESGIIAAAEPSDNLATPPELPPSENELRPPADSNRTAQGNSGAATTTVPPIRPMDSDPQLRAPGQRTRAQGSSPGVDSGELSRPARMEEVDNDLQRLRELKFKQFEEAVKSGSAVAYNAKANGGARAVASVPQLGSNSREADLARLAAIRAEISNTEREESTAQTYQQKLAQLRGGAPAISAGSGAAPAPAPGQGAPSNDLAKFNGNADRWRLDSEDEAPAQFQLTTGHIIPTVLLTSINSELPGPIVAQVTRDIYDTATGKHLLIPQGTKVYGGYSSDIVYGQASLMVAAQRLVYPDGKTRDLGSMPAADASGSTGMRDQVNNHYVRIFGSSFLMSGITAGVALSQPNQSGVSQQPTARSALSEALGQQLGQTASQMLAKNLNIAPTLMIRPGYRFNIIVVKDLTFKTPYKPFDYNKRK